MFVFETKGSSQHGMLATSAGGGSQKSQVLVARVAQYYNTRVMKWAEGAALCLQCSKRAIVRRDPRPARYRDFTHR